MSKHSIYIALLFALCVVLCFMILANRTLDRDLRRSEAQARQFKGDIQAFAASMAAKQLDIGKATFLMCGPQQVNPSPVFGQPVCQFDCITTEPQIWFMEAYVRVLEEHQNKTDLEHHPGGYSEKPQAAPRKPSE